MLLKPNGNIDELCYPFIFEKSAKCDFEIVTDQLCRSLGTCIDQVSEEFPDLYEEWDKLQPLVFHLNGSIRGRLAISEQDLDWLKTCYHQRQEEVKEHLSGFVLPRGKAPVGELNQCSSQTKQAIRWMVRLQREEEVEVPDVLSRFANLLCNYFFVCTMVINRRRGEKEIPFESKSYGAAAK